MYLVIRRGVYMQGVFGVFDQSIDALNHAVNSILEESDCYHDFIVHEIAKGERLNHDTFIECRNTNYEYHVVKRKAVLNKDKVIIRHREDIPPKIKNSIYHKEFIKVDAIPDRN